MREIAEMTRHLVEAGQELRQPTPFPAISACSNRLPKLRRQIRETYKNSSAAVATIPCGRSSPAASLNRPKSGTADRKQVGPLTGFRNKMGRPSPPPSS